MRRTHRFPRRLVRSTSLIVSYALLLSISITNPFRTTAKAPRSARTTNVSLKPQLPQSTSGRERAPRNAGKRVESTPAEHPAPTSLPTIDEVRHRKSEKPQAPPPIPSTKRSPRKDKFKEKKTAQAATRESSAYSTAMNEGKTGLNLVQRRAEAQTRLTTGIKAGSSYRDFLSFISPRPALLHHAGLSFLRSLRLAATEQFDLFLPPMPQTGGSKIVFASNREGSMQIYVMNGDGSGATRLSNTNSNDDVPR